MIKADIILENPTAIELLRSEFKKLEQKRFTITTDNAIHIEADDGVAFKAAVNSIANSIIIFEKMQGINNE